MRNKYYVNKLPDVMIEVSSDIESFIILHPKNSAGWEVLSKNNKQELECEWHMVPDLTLLLMKGAL